MTGGVGGRENQSNSNSNVVGNKDIERVRE